MTPISSQLQILFATFPPQSGDVGAQIAAFGIALEGHDPQDIEAAIRRFIRGEVADHNPSFAPTSAMLGKVVTKCRDDRLESERRSNPPRALEYREVDKGLPVEERGDFVRRELARANLELPDKRTPDAKATHKLFGGDPDTSPEAMAESLLGYTTGSPESEEAAL